MTDLLMERYDALVKQCQRTEDALKAERLAHRETAEGFRRYRVDSGVVIVGLLLAWGIWMVWGR